MGGSEEEALNGSELSLMSVVFRFSPTDPADVSGLMVVDVAPSA